MSAEVAAALQLEQELDRMLAAFASEHAELVRRACQVPEGSADLAAVVVTTMFGHTLARMRRERGRTAVQVLASVLLDQHDQADARAASLRHTPGGNSGSTVH